MSGSAQPFKTRALIKKCKFDETIYLGMSFMLGAFATMSCWSRELPSAFGIICGLSRPWLILLVVVGGGSGNGGWCLFKVRHSQDWEAELCN